MWVVCAKSKSISRELSLAIMLSIICWASFFQAAIAKRQPAPDTGRLERISKEVDQQLGDLVKYQRSRDGWLGDGSLPDGVRAIKDISYIETDGKQVASPSQKLDLYLPGRKDKAPLVIWIHGGGWRSGDKRGGPIRPLLEAGFAVASINYRLSQEAKWPAQLDDCINASKFLFSQSDKYGFDATRVGLWGASAGGHLALMESLSLSAPDRERIGAVCDWFGPCDLEAYLQSKDALPSAVAMIKDLLGGDENKLLDSARQASPTHLLNSEIKIPPVLILHGKNDKLVPPLQSREFAERAKAAGASDLKLDMVKGGHGFPGFGIKAIKTSIDFLSKRLKAG